MIGGSIKRRRARQDPKDSFDKGWLRAHPGQVVVITLTGRAKAKIKKRARRLERYQQRETSARRTD